MILMLISVMNKLQTYVGCVVIDAKKEVLFFSFWGIQNC